MIEVARPQSAIVGERGRALIIQARARDRRDTPSSPILCRPPASCNAKRRHVELMTYALAKPPRAN